MINKFLPSTIFFFLLGLKDINDILLVIDVSDRVDTETIQKFKIFSKSFIKSFDIGTSSTHFALVTFDNKPMTILDFHEGTQLEKVSDLLSMARRQNSAGRLDIALQQTFKMLKNRKNYVNREVPSYLVVLTKNPSKEELDAAANIIWDIESGGTKVFIVVIDDDVKKRPIILKSVPESRNALISHDTIQFGQLLTELTHGIGRTAGKRLLCWQNDYTADQFISAYTRALKLSSPLPPPPKKL